MSTGAGGGKRGESRDSGGGAGNEKAAALAQLAPLPLDAPAVLLAARRQFRLAIGLVVADFLVQALVLDPTCLGVFDGHRGHGAF